MTYFEKEVKQAHPTWQPILRAALRAIEKDSPGYLEELENADFLPNEGRIFAAFSLAIDEVKYVLVGEGPYPRAQSANGYCFMDAAVESLWSAEKRGGLSKAVNRATSLRNFLKMLLVAEGHIPIQHLSPDSISDFVSMARNNESLYVQTMADLQENFLRAGFLLLNASLVYRKDVAPNKDARAWFSFMEVIVSHLENYHRQHLGLDRVCFLIWGKIADQCLRIPALQRADVFDIARAEHPYNLTFIQNPLMWRLFSAINLLRKSA